MSRLHLDPSVLVVCTPGRVVLSDSSTTITVTDFVDPPQADGLQLDLSDWPRDSGPDLLRALDSLGWLVTTPPPRAAPEGALTLAAAIVVARSMRPLPNVVLAGEEALVFAPSLEHAERRRQLRRFVSRLDWRRLRAYSPLSWRSDGYEVLGDVDAGALSALDEIQTLAATDTIVAQWHNSRWRESVGEVVLPVALRGQSLRLAITEIVELSTADIAFEPGRPLWIASGIFAQHNLAFVPDLTERTTENRWCMGVSSHIDEAVIKARAEGVERHALGNYDIHDLTSGAAEDLTGDVFHPGPLLGYSRRQCESYLLTEFDPRRPEWWVRGEDSREHPSWLPAALVFSPFGERPSWLHPGYSSSNGSAADPDRRTSQLKAWWELNERDAFLRTYLGRRPPPSLALKELPSDLRRACRSFVGVRQDAELAFVLMRSGLGLAVHACVALVEGRLVVGASAQPDGSQALVKAMHEVVMQLQFPIERPEIAAEDVRTPEDHSRLYAVQHHSLRAGWLLRGRPDARVVDNPKQVDHLLKEARFYSKVEAGLYVSRSLDPRLIPLTFGYDTLPEENELALSCTSGGYDPYPHPFA